MNVRTYVTCNGKPGIYFFSLDASKRAPVEAARLLHLPYLHAGMKISGNGERTGYDSERSDRRGNPAVFSAHYGPTDGAIFHAQPGTTLHWLTERYCLYAVDRHGGIFSIDIHHWPWPLQSAVLILSRNTMAESHGVRLSAAEPLLTFTKRLDVLFWPPAKVQA